MSQQFTNQSGLTFTITSKPFATGGEGGVYDVLSPTNSGLVAKIYHNAEIANGRREKIIFMHANNPTDTAAPEVKNAIIWVEEILYNQQRQFVGFLMPKVRESITLKSLTLVQNPSKKHGEAWKKFDHNVMGSHQKRLVVAYNLAQAINAIHERGNYVLVDMKPENVFVRPDATISLVDLDSIQINAKNEQGILKFPAKVFTEEYVPPEKYYEAINHSKGTIKESWDHFSLSVIIYELLFGIHPFQASHKNLTTRSELIQGGYFVQGSKKEELHKIPHFHKNFQKLTPEIREQFYNTFEKGHTEPAIRTTPKLWSETLLSAINLPAVQNTLIDVRPLPTKNKPKNSPQFDKVAGKKKPKPQVINMTSPKAKRTWKDYAKLASWIVFPILVWFFIFKSDNPKPTADRVGNVVQGSYEFGVGSYESDVLRIQGTPDKILEPFPGRDYKMYYYGESVVRFLDGKVKDYHDEGNLHTR